MLVISCDTNIFSLLWEIIDYAFRRQYLRQNCAMNVEIVIFKEFQVVVRVSSFVGNPVYKYLFLWARKILRVAYHRVSQKQGNWETSWISSLISDNGLLTFISASIKKIERLVSFPKCRFLCIFKIDGDIKRLNSFVDFLLSEIWKNFLMSPSILEKKIMDHILEIPILKNYIFEIIPLETKTIKKSSFNSHVYSCFRTKYNRF